MKYGAWHHRCGVFMKSGWKGHFEIALYGHENVYLPLYLRLWKKKINWFQHKWWHDWPGLISFSICGGRLCDQKLRKSCWTNSVVRPFGQRLFQVQKDLLSTAIHLLHQIKQLMTLSDFSYVKCFRELIQVKWGACIRLKWNLRNKAVGSCGNKIAAVVNFIETAVLSVRQVMWDLISPQQTSSYSFRLFIAIKYRFMSAFFKDLWLPHYNFIFSWKEKKISRSQFQTSAWKWALKVRLCSFWNKKDASLLLWSLLIFYWHYLFIYLGN